MMEAGTALFTVLIVVYAAPSVIAVLRGHHQTNAIFLLNLLLGWTFLGWVGALIWSVSATAGRPRLDWSRMSALEIGARITGAALAGVLLGWLIWKGVPTFSSTPGAELPPAAPSRTTASQANPTTPAETVIVSTESARLRAGPGFDQQVLAYATYGAAFPVLSRQPLWVEVEIPRDGGSPAWVYYRDIR